MVLSRRERYIAMTTAAVIALAGMWQLVVWPLLDRRAEVDEKLEVAQQEMLRAQRLFAASARLSRQWSQMLSGGLQRDASAAESQILNSVRDWAQDAELSLSSIRPERSGEKEKDVYKITFRATATGNMAQVGRFLWRIQTTQIPVRIVDLTISSRREGTDDLSLNLGISTIHLPPEQTRSSAREAQP